MAEQNRKTPDQKLWRNRAKDTVDIYIEAIYAEVRNRDIAMESRHILSQGLQASQQGFRSETFETGK